MSDIPRGDLNDAADLAVGDRVTVVRRGVWRYGQTGTVRDVAAFTALVDFGDGPPCAFLGVWLATG